MTVQKKIGNIVLDDSQLTAERALKPLDRDGSLADMRAVMESSSQASYSNIGTDGYIILPKNSVTSPGVFSHTVIFTAMFPAGALDTGNYPNFLHAGAYATTNPNVWSLEITGNNSYRSFRYSEVNTAGSYAYSTSSLPSGSVNIPDTGWHTYAVVRDTTNDLVSFFTDGVKGNTYAYTTDVNLIDSAYDGAIGRRIGSHYIVGKNNFSRVLRFNYALSEDKIRKYSSGSKLDFEDIGGSMIDKVTNGTFTGSTSGWEVGGFSYGTNNVVGSGSIPAGLTLSQTIKFEKGKRYRLSMTVSTNSANTPIRFYGHDIIANTPITTSFIVTASASATPVSIEFTANWTSGSGNYIRIGHTDGGNYGSPGVTIDDISIVQLGAVMALEPESATSTIWYDESGNSLDGIVSGATLVNTPKYLNTDYGSAVVKQELMDSNNLLCYRFNGTSAKIQLSDHNNFSFVNEVGNDNPFTMLVSSRFSVGNGSNRTLISKGGNGLQEEYFLIQNDNQLIVQLTALAGSPSLVKYFPVTMDDAFHTQIVTYDGTKTGAGLNAYIDGMLQQPTSVVGDGTYTGMANGTQFFRIGSEYNRWYHFGEMNRVVLFNYSLPESKLRRYSAGAKLDWEDVGGTMRNTVLTNGSFEGTFVSGLAPGWTKVGANAVASEITGRLGVGKAQRLTVGGTVDNDVGVRATIIANRYYRPQVWVRTSRSGITIAVQCNSGGMLSSYVYTMKKANTWEHIVPPRKLWADGTVFYIYADTGFASGDTIDFDDVLENSGALLALEPESATPTTWYDESGNVLDGFVTDASLANAQKLFNTASGPVAVKKDVQASTISNSYMRFLSGATGSSRLTILDNSNLTFALSPFFVLARVKRTDTSTSALPISKEIGANKEYLLYMPATDGSIFVGLYSGSGSNYISATTSTASIADTEWHTVCITHDGSNNATGFSIYLDGLKIPYTTGGGGTYTGMQNTTVNLVIGDEGFSSKPSLLSRYIMGNYALSEEKVRRLSNGSMLDWEDIGGLNNLYGSNAGSVTDEANSTTGWVQGLATASFTSTLGNAHTGSYHLAYSGSANGARMDYAFPVIAGKTYSVEYYSRNFSGSMDAYVATTNAGDNYGNRITGTLTTPSSGATYVSNKVTFTATSTGTYYFSIRATGAYTGQVDSVTIYQLGAVLDLEPDNISDAIWLDASGNSQNAVVTGALAAKFTPSYSSKNYIINGAFDFNQRGVTVTVDGSYASDRWFLNKDVTTCSMARQPASWSVSGWMNRLTLTTRGSNSTMFAAQPLETAMVKQLAGKYVTISCLLSRNSTLSSGNVGIFLITGTGTDQKIPTGGSTLTSLISATSIPTSGANRFSATFLVPSTATSLLIGIGMSAATGNWADGSVLDYSEVMLNEGPVAAPFQRCGGDIGGELVLCQRYYEKSYELGTTPGTTSSPGAMVINGFTSTSSQKKVWINYQVIKRSATPTMYLWDYTTNGGAGAAGRLSTLADTTRTDNVTPSAYTISSKGIEVGVNATTATGLIVHWVADAEL